MKDKTTLELAFRLNELARQIDTLEIEYNQIIDELCDRITDLKNDVNMQKKRVRRLDEGRYIQNN